MNTTHTVPTDSQKTITVESRIAYALWQQGRVFAGFAADFEVKTILVSDGSKVKVACRTEKGKKLGSVEGVTVLNRFRGKIVIPESVTSDDYVYLEIELPKHGVKGESNAVPVRPPLAVSSITWSKKEIHREEDVTLTCTFTNGVEEDDAVTVMVYEYDPDGCHDLVVMIPAEVKSGKVEIDWIFTYQGDAASVPTELERSAFGKKYCNPEYFFTVAVENICVGKNQESGLLTFREKLNMQMLDAYGIVMKQESFKVRFADGAEKKYTTDDNGFITEESIPPGRLFVEYVRG